MHQTAKAHLYSSLLKIKAIAASTDLPDQLRTGVPKPELSEEEKISLHNVTSGLYNREQVKQVIDKAVSTVCQALNVPVPEKSKRSRKEKRKEESQEEKEDVNSIMLSRAAAEDVDMDDDNEEDDDVDGDEDEDEDVTDFEGFESDIDEPGPVAGSTDPETDDKEEVDFSQYDHLLGSASENEAGSGDESWDESILAKYRGTEKANLDDISVSGGSDAESSPSDDEEDESAPPVESQKKKQKAESKLSKKVTAPPTDSTFLPSLMGGYVSGSESASDIDVEPPKKRRGQRARQAIWEKKYGSGAKHLQKAAQEEKQGRDSGWDMRRGAVGQGDGGRRTPWKQGVNDPFSKGNAPARNDKRQSRQPQQRSNTYQAPEPPRRPPPKKDNEGPLHPSWEARKKAKESQKGAEFAGKKITFD